MFDLYDFKELLTLTLQLIIIQIDNNKYSEDLCILELLYLIFNNSKTILIFYLHIFYIFIFCSILIVDLLES